MLLNNQWITEEFQEEIKKYLETNDNENTMIQNLLDAAQNLWETVKADLRGKFITIQSYFRKQETSETTYT